MTKPNGHKKCVRGRYAIGCVLSIPRSVPLAAADHSRTSRGAYRQTTPVRATSAGKRAPSHPYSEAQVLRVVQLVVIDSGVYLYFRSLFSTQVAHMVQVREVVIPNEFDFHIIVST